MLELKGLVLKGINIFSFWSSLLFKVLYDHIDHILFIAKDYDSIMTVGIYLRTYKNDILTVVCVCGAGIMG